MEEDQTTGEAVIYCRSATAGDDRLDAQESRCRDHARGMKLEVVGVFRDVASGRTVERPGMAALMRWLETQERGCIVLVDDASRIARDIAVHNQLDDAIRKAGGIVTAADATAMDNAVIRRATDSNKWSFLPQRDR